MLIFPVMSHPMLIIQKVNLLVYAKFPQRKEARRIVSHGLHTSILKL